MCNTDLRTMTLTMKRVDKAPPLKEQTFWWGETDNKSASGYQLHVPKSCKLLNKKKYKHSVANIRNIPEGPMYKQCI